ncbi:hypothetical protein [Algoriphagus limi]|uniref:Uncharacterized protein n=1 Tax=Algoriphagus limi TaxID=2975273 RepID=A0ABT2G4C6_9BACT|nr:hypothetical protein [Algoriphagus limi]MCS5488890.1 hypothetical protein [Algoriphagus limi]
MLTGSAFLGLQIGWFLGSIRDEGFLVNFRTAPTPLRMVVGTEHMGTTMKQYSTTVLKL